MKLEWIYPKPLPSGGTIAFTVPASAHQEELELLKHLWEKEGYRIVFGPSCYRQGGMYGGSKEEQAAEFNELMTDKSCDVVMAIRGGYGSIRYLDLLDYDEIRKKGKAFVGYSDCTALHCALQRRSALITYHGPMGVDLQKNRADDFRHLLELLQGKTRVIEPLPTSARGCVATDEETGRIFGGNLSLVSALCGTDYGLTEEMLKGQILFLEEVQEPPYKMDRMLQQLRLNGVFKSVRAVALGNFLDCHAAEKDPEEEKNYDVGEAVLELLQENGEEDKFVFYLPTGHGTPHRAIPLGSEISFRLVANSMICLPYTRTTV